MPSRIFKRNPRVGTARRPLRWRAWMRTREKARQGPMAPEAVERRDVGSAKPPPGRLGGPRSTRGGRGGRTLAKGRKKRKTFSTVGATRAARTARRPAARMGTMPLGGRRPKQRTGKLRRPRRTMSEANRRSRAKQDRGRFPGLPV